MSDEVPTYMTWEGVPITELSREELMDALRAMHHMQKQHFEELTTRSAILRGRRR